MLDAEAEEADNQTPEDEEMLETVTDEQEGNADIYATAENAPAND